MKIIMLLGMLVSHVLLALGIPFFNFSIGWIIAPFFCVLIGYNLHLTSDASAYRRRVFVWGVIAEPAHYLLFSSGGYRPNMLLMIWAAMICMVLVSKFPDFDKLDSKFPRLFFYSFYAGHLYLILFFLLLS